MTDKKPIRVLLADETTQTKVCAYGYDQEWIMNAVHAKDPVAQTFELVFETPDHKTVINYIENFQIGMRYLSLKGERAAAVATELERKLKCRPVAQVLERARAAKTFQERVRTLYEVALTAPAEPEPERYQLVEKALSDSDSQLRHAAILAIAYLGWPRFSAPLEAMAKTDESEQNRKDAALLAGRLAALPTV